MDSRFVGGLVHAGIFFRGDGFMGGRFGLGGTCLIIGV